MHGKLPDNHESLSYELQLKLRQLLDELHELLAQRESRSVTPIYPELTAERVKGMLRARRTRDKIFGDELFADPAWDILLESLAAYLRRQKISVSGLCAVAAVPATTALRWIVKLEQEGLLTREDDPLDHRRTWICITEAGLAAMLRYFASVEADHCYLNLRPGPRITNDHEGGLPRVGWSRNPNVGSTTPTLEIRRQVQVGVVFGGSSRRDSTAISGRLQTVAPRIATCTLFLRTHSNH